MFIGKIQKKPLMVLLDAGSERSVIQPKHSQHGKVLTKRHIMKLCTPSGTDATDMEFSLNEFSESSQVRCKFHVLPVLCSNSNFVFVLKVNIIS